MVGGDMFTWGCIYVIVGFHFTAFFVKLAYNVSGTDD